MFEGRKRRTVATASHHGDRIMEHAQAVYVRNGSASGGDARFTLDMDGIESFTTPPRKNTKTGKETTSEVAYVNIPSEAGPLRFTLRKNIYVPGVDDDVSRLTLDLGCSEVTVGHVEAANPSASNEISMAIYKALKTAKQLEPMAQYLTETEGYSLKKARIMAQGLGCTK